MMLTTKGTAGRISKGPADRIMEKDLGRPLRAEPVMNQAPAGLGHTVTVSDAACDMCADGGYPHYGVAPHICYDRLGKNIGQSELLPSSTWTKECYVPEIEDQEEWADTSYPAGCGVYFCPKCRKGYDRAWRRVLEIHGQPPQKITAKAIEAPEGGETTRWLDPADESAVGKADLPKG